MKLNREEMYKAYMKVENFYFTQISDDIKIGVVKRSDVTEFYREIVLPAFYYIEALEAENKELKAKLEAIESNKVVQFSDKASNSGCSNKNECMLENGDMGNWAMCISDILKAGERYTVIISKETK